MTSHREERRKSGKWEDKVTTTQIDTPRIKFTRKDISPSKQLVPIDNMIRRMNAGELIKKSDPSSLEQKILIDEQKFDENMDTSNYLHQLKKGYDELVKLSTKRQSETTRMREQIDMIRKKVKNSTESSESQKKYIEEMEKRWEGLRLKQETTVMASKTLEHMLDRMKKDEVVHQLKVNELQFKVKEMQAQIMESRSKNMSLYEFEALSNMAVKSVQEHYLEAKEQRKRDMAHFQSIIVKRKEADQREEERQRVTDDIQAMAASDLNDSDMIKWKKLLMVQKFLKRVLKFKIVNLQQKYSDVKNAFYTIKLRTNISDPSNLANSYFNLEDTYQKLLENVRHLEEKVGQLDQQKKALQYSHDEVKSQILLLTKDRDSKASTTLARQAYQLTQKSFQSELTEDRIYFWLINNMYKLDSANQKLAGNKNKYYEEYSKEKLAEHLNKFCQQLLESVQGLGEETAKEPISYNLLRTLEATTNKNIVEDADEDEREIDRQDFVRRDFQKKHTRKL